MLRAAEREFDALVTMDRNMEHQRNLGSVDLGVILISAEENGLSLVTFNWCHFPMVSKVVEPYDR